MMTHLRKIVAVIAISLLFQSVSLAQLSPKSSDDNAAVKFRNNVFQLTAKFSDEDMRYGFGFVVGEKGKKLYVITAAHVVCFDEPDIKTEEILVRFYENRGKSYKAELLDLSYPGLDMAMLEVPKPSENYVWERKYFFSRPKRNDKVWFVGKNREWYIPTDAGIGYISKPPFMSEKFMRRCTASSREHQDIP